MNDEKREAAREKAIAEAEDRVSCSCATKTPQDWYRDGFDDGYASAMSQFVSFDDLPDIRKMSDEDARAYLDKMGSVTAQYDPVRRKNIVSVEPYTEADDE